MSMKWIIWCRKFGFTEMNISYFVCVFTARHQFGTPFPIVNQSQKGLFEKVVDYLINDGPSSRYGMICKECYGHNGKSAECGQN